MEVLFVFLVIEIHKLNSKAALSDQFSAPLRTCILGKNKTKRIISKCEIKLIIISYSSYWDEFICKKLVE